MVQMEAHEERRPHCESAAEPLTMHYIAVLDRSRYLRMLIPRLPILTVMYALLAQIWDAQLSNDIFIRCARNVPLLTPTE